VADVAGYVIDWMKKLIKWRHPAAKNYGFKRIVMAQEAGIDVICRDATALVVTHAPKKHRLGTTDSAIALTSMDIAAPSLGLATCWGGFVMAAAGYHKPLVKYLEIPKGQVLTGVMLIGLPKFGYERLPARNEAKINWL
jgi:nitroreductase